MTKLMGATAGIAVGSVVAYRQRTVTCMYEGGSVGRYPVGHCPVNVEAAIRRK